MAKITVRGLNTGSTYFIQLDGWNGNVGTFNIQVIDNGITGINKLNVQTPKFDIYPNPSDGALFIDFNFELNGSLKLALIDMLGQIVYSQEYRQIKNNHLTLDLNNLNKGIYFLKIDGEERMTFEKIIIR